jgi:hypothetical protein
MESRAVGRRSKHVFVVSGKGVGVNARDSRLGKNETTDVLVKLCAVVTVIIVLKLLMKLGKPRREFIPCCSAKATTSDDEFDAEERAVFASFAMLQKFRASVFHTFEEGECCCCEWRGE